MTFNDCAIGDRVTRGDPYIVITTEDNTVGGGDESSWMLTRRMTGALRFERSDGTHGRTEYDCTRTTTLQNTGGLATFATTSSGTIRWEYPIGIVTTLP
jgi:hypothetical protein